MIAIWARILIFGTGLMAMFRFGNPIRQVLGVISSMRHFKDAQVNIADVEKNERVSAAMQAYRVAVLQSWPDIAEKLVQGGFQTSVRRVEQIIPQQQDLYAMLTELWQQALNATLDRKSRTFSNFALQIVFNLPSRGQPKTDTIATQKQNAAGGTVHARSSNAKPTSHKFASI